MITLVPVCVAVILCVIIFVSNIIIRNKNISLEELKVLETIDYEKYKQGLIDNGWEEGERGIFSKKHD